MDRSGADQKLVRRPSCSGATSGAGWQDSTTRCQRSSAPRVHFAAALYTSDAVAADVVHLARTRYAGTNHSHLSELLSEPEGIDIGRTTLRRILVNAGLSRTRRRRQPKHRVRRQQMLRMGMLIQMDGSHHPWLGNRMPPFTLLVAVDDATGTVVDALFCNKEDAHSYFLLIHGLL